jgi:hypothetical protein
MPKKTFVAGRPRRRRRTDAEPRKERREKKSKDSTGVSRWKLAAGAVGLFLFIIGVMRSWPTGIGDGREPGSAPDGGEARAATR